MLNTVPIFMKICCRKETGVKFNRQIVYLIADISPMFSKAE